MSWKVYNVTLTDDEESQIGKKETLVEIQINETIASWDRAVLNVPPRTFNYGLHKLVFRFEIETFEPSIPFFKEAFTYVNITPSPLQPVLLDGSPSKVSRGNQNHYMYISYTVSNFYGTEIEIWAGFGPVGSTEKKCLDQL